MADPAYDIHRLSGGRFVLGLGSQIKPHIELRYSMPWSRPAARMQEYIAARTRDLAHLADRRPAGLPGRLLHPHADAAAVQPGSARRSVTGDLAGRRRATDGRGAGAGADGFICHPLLSRCYLAEALRPALDAGRASSGATGPFTIAAMAMVVTGRTEEAYAAAVAGTKRQIGFYASTPAYKPVLDHHGGATFTPRRTR